MIVENQNKVYLSEEMITTLSTCISNKEALRDKIHEIHNFLRNSGAGYGMYALKVFNLLYGLKKIHEYSLLDKVKLNSNCNFQYLLDLANKGEDKKVTDLILGNSEDTVLQSIYNSEIRHLIFYEIPKNMRETVIPQLIKEINEITLIEKACNVLLSGKIYEYFIGRDQTAISELGAYFTDRHITDYIYQRLAIQVGQDGKIGTMVDPFGGSGGFTTGYIDYLCKTYNGIDWASEIHKVHHYDMNEDVIKSAGLEFFCLTGELPSKDNLAYKNSFSDEFLNCRGQKMLFDYVITNPPFGGDDNSKQSKIKRGKIRKYIKAELATLTDPSVKKMRLEQLKKLDAIDKQYEGQQVKTRVCLATCSQRIKNFALKHNIKNANNKEACSLILMMDLLAPDGVCCGVLKEGVIFDNTYTHLRQILIKEYNVSEVISVPQDQFENTSTKTSIIIFKNTPEKTKEVIFRDLVVEKYDADKFQEIKGEIVLVENKGDIKCVNDVIISQASAAEILQTPKCSLDGKVYNKKEVVCGEDYKMVRLGDVCEFVNGKKKNTSEGKDVGFYPLFSSSLKIDYWVDEYDYDKYCIICNTINGSGKFNIHYAKQFSVTNNTIVFSLENIICLKYIYYYGLCNLHKISELANGSTKKKLGKFELSKFEIPIPKSQEKLKEWVSKISAPFDRKNENEKRLKDLEDGVRDKIKYITENEDCDDEDFMNMCHFEKKKNKYKASDGYNQGTYRFYSSSQDKLLYRDDYEFENKHILIGRGGVASLHLASKFSVSHDDVYVISTKYNIDYIYYYLMCNKDLISNSFKGSTIKHSSKGALSEIKIKIPKNKQLIRDLEPLFKEIEDLKMHIKNDEKLFQQYIEELRVEAVPEQVDTQPQLIQEQVQSDEETKTETASIVSSKTSLKDLKEQCKSLGIKGYSKLNKEQLIEKIQKHKV
jgi:type I restriction-modification system DNA methylase subunit